MSHALPPNAPQAPAALQQAQWPTKAGLRALVAALGEENVRWVGGAVRDTLLGAQVHDVDCATTHTPGTVIDRCRAAGIRTIPTGIDHGTVTAVLEDGTVEITTLRHDVSTDGRRATIAFASQWRDDAARRDFTINALYAHPATLEISDYFGGMDDLAARRVRFIGEARQRIAEDHLRILRYYRFQARFGAALDQEAEDACSEMAATLKGLSRERVADELLRLLSLPDPGATVERMFDRGVLPVIVPECTRAQIGALRALIAAEADEGHAPDPVRRLAALLPPSPDIAEDVAARLRLSKAQRARLINAAERVPDDALNPHKLAYHLSVPLAVDRLLLLNRETAMLSDWTPPSFPLKGGTIVARGIGAGPQVARIMQSVEKRWVEEGFPNPARVEQLLAEELNQS